MKHIVLLPDGREIGSGAWDEDAVISAELTETVNDDGNISPGSVCAAMVKLKILANDGLPDTDGAWTLLQEEGGVRRQVGIFLPEKPERTDPRTVTVTAYDRVSLLDRDVTDTLRRILPCTVQELAEAVCDACGLELTGDPIPNGNRTVRPFSSRAVTGRQVIRWVGQTAGRFFRANPDGTVSFGWYAPSLCRVFGGDPYKNAVTAEDGTLTVSLPFDETAWESGTLTPDGRVVFSADGSGCAVLSVEDAHAVYYYQGQLTRGDYETADIDRVQIRASADDVGTIYPDVTGNTFAVEGNPLLTAESAEELLPAAQTLFGILSPVRYTPCRVTVPWTADIRAGDILPVLDGDGTAFYTYVMTVTTDGGRMMLECTGDRTLEKSNLRHQSSYTSLSGRMAELHADVEKLETRVTEQAEKETADIDGVVSQTTEQVTAVLQTSRAMIAQALENYAETSDVETLRQQISTRFEQTAELLQMTFRTATEQIASVNGELQEKYNERTKYIRFQDGDIILGMEGNEIALTIKNDCMLFKQNGQEVASFRYNRFYVKDALFTDSARIGAFHFVPGVGGNLSFGKAGD